MPTARLVVLLLLVQLVLVITMWGITPALPVPATARTVLIAQTALHAKVDTTWSRALANCALLLTHIGLHALIPIFRLLPVLQVPILVQVNASGAPLLMLTVHNATQLLLAQTVVQHSSWTMVPVVPVRLTALLAVMPPHALPAKVDSMLAIATVQFAQQ